MKSLGAILIGGVTGATLANFMIVPTWVLLLALAIGAGVWFWGALIPPTLRISADSEATTDRNR